MTELLVQIALLLAIFIMMTIATPLFIFVSFIATGRPDLVAFLRRVRDALGRDSKQQGPWPVHLGRIVAIDDRPAADELDWELVEHDSEDTISDHWRAKAPQLNGEYNVVILEYMPGAGSSVLGAFYTEGKPPHDIYRGDDGASIDEAKAAAQEHHNAASRAARWAAHMRDNEPPADMPPMRVLLGAGDPRDPATKDSNCRRCGSCTQWGWCPNCQPAEFNRLP